MGYQQTLQTAASARLLKKMLNIEINVWSDLACRFLYARTYIKQWK